MGNLQRLEILSIKMASLTGLIPPTIFNISSLELINFSSAMMSGSLPDDMCISTPKLKFIYLSWNEFDGQIPSTLGECRELQIISLSVNKFSGIIPRGIGNLTMLKELYLGDNNITGKIPEEMGNLQRLEILSIKRAGLTSLIPSFIFNISSLKELYLQGNSLYGSLPVHMCSHLPMLEVLFLSSNKLTGSIPGGIGNCTSLKQFSLDENNFTGFAFCYSVLAINFMDIAIAIANYQRGSPNEAYSSGFRPITHKGCEREVSEAANGVSDELKSERIIRLSWALVHSKQPEDMQHGIAMLEASLANSGSPLQKREKLYLLAVGYYRSGEYRRSRQLAEQCLEVFVQ